MDCCSWAEAALKWITPVDAFKWTTPVDSKQGIPFQNTDVLGDERRVEEPGAVKLNAEELCKDEGGEEELRRETEHPDEFNQVERTASEEESQKAELPKEIEYPNKSNQVERTEAVYGETRRESKCPDRFQEDGGHLSKSGSIKSYQCPQLAIKPKSPDFQDTPFDMDPLVARAHHNLTKSWLLQFPTDILIAIMEQLQDSDLLRLRRTCRIFMIRFGFKAFQRCHQVSDRLTGELWQCSSTVDLDIESCQPDDILKEMYCSTCFTALDRRFAGGPTPEQDFLHCGGCGSDHQAQAFSATQSQMPPQERICIGLEGRFSLCEHVSLSWNDVVKTWASGNTKVAECSHPSHVFARDHDGYQSSEKPKAELKIGSEDEFWSLVLTKDTHVLLDKQGRDRPTAQQLRQRLEDIERISPCPWYPLDFPRISPMRLVDPNICLCLEYEGADRIDWHLRGPRSDPEAGIELQERCWSSSKTGDNPKVCDDEAHNQRTSRGDAWVEACFFECSDACARLRLRNAIHLGIGELKPWWSGWYRALDPLSFDLPDFFGVTWCMSKRCRNYIKHPWNCITGFEYITGRHRYWSLMDRECICPEWREKRH